MSETTPSSYLTIRFEGPEIKPGRMRLDDFVQAAKEFSVCAKRVALALHQTPSTAKGRRADEVVTALSLDLVGFTHGSPAAVAYLERSPGQSLMEPFEQDLGELTYKTLVEGIDSVANGGDALPQGFDLGVLMKLRDMGKLFGKGVTSMKFTLNHRAKPVVAIYDQAKCQRIRDRISKPEAQLQTITGRLEMADFKETCRALRIHPPVGLPVECTFPESLSTEVKECITQHVKVSGRMEYKPSGEPHNLEITDIEPIEVTVECESSNSTVPWTYGFWENPTAEEYANRQGVKPIQDFSTIFGAGKDEDWDGFEDELKKWRTERTAE